MIMSNHNPHHHHTIKLQNSNRQTSLINPSPLLSKATKDISSGTFVAALTNNNSDNEATTSLYTQVKGNADIPPSKVNINMQVQQGIQSELNPPPPVNTNTTVIPTKLYVTNFPFTCSQRQIQDLFSRYGQVVECTLKKDYYAYIQYTNTRSAQSAFKNANGLRMLGRKLTVHLATSKKSQSHLNHPNGIVNALASNLSDGVTSSPSPNLTTNLLSSSQAAIVLNNINNTKIVHIRNFPESCSQQQIRDCFKAYGEILECLILHDSYAFVHFKFVEDARLALQSTNNMSFMQQNLLVQYSRSKFKQQNPQASHSFQKSEPSLFNENTNSSSSSSSPNINKLIDNLCLNDSSQSSGECNNHVASDDQDNNRIPKLIEKHVPASIHLNGSSLRKNSLDKSLAYGDKHQQQHQSGTETEYDSEIEKNHDTHLNVYSNNNGYIGYHNNENHDDMTSNDYSDDERRYFNQYNQQNVDHQYRKTFTNSSYMNQDTEYESPPVRTKLYVTNFPEDMDQEEMKQLFNNYGNVLECTIMWNQYAFVHFGSYQEAEKALLAIKGVQYKGCKISVQWSTSAKYQQPKQHNNLTIASKITYPQSVPSQPLIHGQQVPNQLQAYSPSKKSTVPTKILERPTCINNFKNPSENLTSNTEENEQCIVSKESESKGDSTSVWSKETSDVNSEKLETSDSKTILPAAQSWASIMNKTQPYDFKEIAITSSRKAPDSNKACQFKISFSDIVRSSATAPNEIIPAAAVYPLNFPATNNNKIQMPIATLEKPSQAAQSKQVQIKPRTLNKTEEATEASDCKEKTKLVKVFKENCPHIIRVDQKPSEQAQFKTIDDSKDDQDTENTNKEEATTTSQRNSDQVEFINTTEPITNNQETIQVENEMTSSSAIPFSTNDSPIAEPLTRPNDYNYLVNPQDEKQSKILCETLPISNLMPTPLPSDPINNTTLPINKFNHENKHQIQQQQQQHDLQSFNHYPHPSTSNYPSNHMNIFNNTPSNNVKYPDYYNNKKNPALVVAPSIPHGNLPNHTDLPNHTYNQQPLPPYQHNTLTNQMLNQQQQQLFIQNCQQQYQNGQFPMPNNLIYNQQLQQLQGLNHPQAPFTAPTVQTAMPTGQNVFNQNSNNNTPNFINTPNNVSNQFVPNLQPQQQQPALINNSQGNLWNHPMDNFNSNNTIYNPSAAFNKKPTDTELLKNNHAYANGNINFRGFTQGAQPFKYSQNLMSYPNQMNHQADNSFYSNTFNHSEVAMNPIEYANLRQSNPKCTSNLKSTSFTYNQVSNKPDDDLEFHKKSESININNESDRLARNCISSSSNSSTPTQIISTDGAVASTPTSINSSSISIKPPLHTSIASSLSPTSELLIPGSNGPKITEEKSKIPVNSIEMTSSGSSDSSSSTSSSKSTSFTNSNLFSAFNYSNYVLFPSDGYDISSKQQQHLVHQQIQQHQNTNYFQIEDVLANLMR